MGDLAAALPAYQSALQLNPVSQEILSKAREVKKQVQPPPQASQATMSSQPGATVRQVPEGGVKPPGPTGWSQGLSPAKQAEWLVDCYRMRVDDDYAWGGGNLHGLYDPEATKTTIVKDFLIFCKLAVKHEVIPPGWNWARFLDTACSLLPYAFEKSDAKDKWGGENIFSTMMGGRSLRYTGEVVYGSSCMMGGGGGDDKAYREMKRSVHGKWQQLLSGDRAAEVFGGVGGVEAWKKLHSKLHVQKYF